MIERWGLQLTVLFFCNTLISANEIFIAPLVWQPGATVEYLLSMHEVPGSIPGQRKRKNFFWATFNGYCICNKIDNSLTYMRSPTVDGRRRQTQSTLTPTGSSWSFAIGPST